MPLRSKSGEQSIAGRYYSSAKGTVFKFQVILSISYIRITQRIVTVKEGSTQTRKS